MDRQLFGQVRPARDLLILVVVFGVLGTGATIAQMVFLSRTVDRVFLGGADLAGVSQLLGLMLVAIVVRAGLVWMKEVVAQRGAIRVKSELRRRLLDHLMRLGPAYTRGEDTGELVSTAVGGVERLDAYVGRYLPQAALSALVPLLILLVVLWVDWISALVLLLTITVIPILLISVGSYAEKHIQHQWAALSRMSAYFLDTLQGLPTLKAFGQSVREGEMVEKVSEDFRRKTLKVLRFAFLSGLVLEFMTTVSIALVAVELGIRLLRGDIPFEHAFLVLLLAPEFYRPLRELGVQRHAGMEGKAAARRIFEILNTENAGVGSQKYRESGDRESGVGKNYATPDLLAPDSHAFLDSRSSKLEISISGVDYTYPGNSRPALCGVNLSLPAGTSTALVGPSGSGKSTLVELLLRFRDPESGDISANGVPIEELPVEDWRERVALVPQRPHLFHGSVLENIRLARPSASREDVERAAERAGASGFIRELPRGYETGIGERGARLSGGEAQRLAIARAFLKDTPLLIMDEPTSNLDPESEQTIRRAVERLARGRTVLVVAHRLNTIYSADRIVLLDDGRVIDAGSHAELLERSDLYIRLVNAHGDVPA